MKKLAAIIVAVGITFGITAAVAPASQATIWCKPVRPGGSC